MFIYTGGIPGVGKTTVIRECIILARRANFSIENIEEEKLLCRVTGVNSKIEYEKLSVEIRINARKKILDHVYEIDEQNRDIIRIRDDHFTAPSKDGYWIRPLKEKDKLCMFAFVVIVANPKTILRRRINRGLRLDPDFCDLNKIVLHQEKEIKTALWQAKSLNIPLKILENEGKTTETAKLLFSFIIEK